MIAANATATAAFTNEFIKTTTPPPPGTTTPTPTPPTPTEGEPIGNPLYYGIDENGIPLAYGAGEAWSLLNLMMSLVAFFTLLLSLFTVIRKKREPEYMEEDFIWKQDESKPNGGEWVKPPFRRRRNFLKVLTILLCLIPGLLFFLLENIWLPVTWITECTPLIGAFFVISMCVFIVQLFTSKQVKSKVYFDEEEAPEPLTRSVTPANQTWPAGKVVPQAAQQATSN